MYLSLVVGSNYVLKKILMKDKGSGVWWVWGWGWGWVCVCVCVCGGGVKGGLFIGILPWTLIGYPPIPLKDLVSIKSFL